MLIYNSAGTKNPADTGVDQYDIVECVPLTGMDDTTSGGKKGSMF